MEIMKRDNLTDKIAKFCFDYGVIDRAIDEDELKSIIYNQLYEESFIENIINTLITTTRTRSDINVKELKVILIELEKIRLELEYKNYNKAL